LYSGVPVGLVPHHPFSLRGIHACRLHCQRLLCLGEPVETSSNDRVIYLRLALPRNAHLFKYTIFHDERAVVEASPGYEALLNWIIFLPCALVTSVLTATSAPVVEVQQHLE
jgi:hypothetical protein